MYHLDPVLDKLFETALNQNDLRRLVEEVSNTLKNPIAVYDTSYYILAYSSVSAVRDLIWREGMKRGYCRYEYAAMLSKLARAKDSKASGDSGVQIISDFGSMRRRQEPLIMNSTLVGYIAILENNVPFESIPEEYYHLAACLLAKEVSISKSQASMVAHLDPHSIITALLNDGFANKLLFRHRISGSQLDIASTFCLLVVDTFQFRDTSSDAQLKDALSGFFPNSLSVFHSHHIVILLNLEQQGSRGELFPLAFSTYLKKKHLRGCISDPFDDLYCIKKHYSLCDSALQLSDTSRNQQALIRYDSYKFQRSISLIPENELPFLCRSVVLDIYKNDQIEHTEMFQTLFLYLHTGKSLRKTADLLYVHRNTVAYRMQKLCDRYQLEFKDEFEIFQLYYSCLLVQAINPQQALLPL